MVFNHHLNVIGAVVLETLPDNINTRCDVSLLRRGKDNLLQRCSKFSLVPVFYPSTKYHSCVLLSSLPLSPLMDPKSPSHPDTRTTHVSSIQDYICDSWCLSVH